VVEVRLRGWLSGRSAVANRIVPEPPPLSIQRASASACVSFIMSRV
jgi:hypothetical protein